MSRSAVFAATLGLTLLTAACTGERTGHLAPLNDAARQGGGMPGFAIANTAPHEAGPVTFSLPDGTVLHGRFSIVGNSTPDLVAGPDQLPQGMTARHIFIVASDGHMTMQCDAAISIARHGGGECHRQPDGAAYYIVF